MINLPQNKIKYVIFQLKMKHKFNKLYQGRNFLFQDAETER